MTGPEEEEEEEDEKEEEEERKAHLLKGNIVNVHRRCV